MQNKDFSRELHKSLTYVENSIITSINFEGKTPNLLIDELQFLLNSGCVVLDSPLGSFANILPEERRALLDCTEPITWEEITTKKSAISVRYKSFKPINELYKNADQVPLRLALQNVTTAHEFKLQALNNDSDTWKLTIYYNPTEITFQFWTVEEFGDYITDALILTAKEFNPTQPTSNDQLKRLYSQFAESRYLESILHALRQRIVDHLFKANRHFAEFAKNPFFLQFFLVAENHNSENQKHWLRYFPLLDQREEHLNLLEKVQKELELKNLPLPTDIIKFITEDYLWDSDRSFVGYSFDTETSLYLANWEKEPRAVGSHLANGEQQRRNIATAIMQAFRRETPHLFIFPLFANRQAVGAAVINCPEDIELSARVTPIRSARDLGFLISLALQTDDIVNHLQEEKRKVTQVRTYKHATQSILHVEGTYCMELQAFLKILETTDSVKANPSLEPYVDRLSYIVREKIGMIKEFSGASDPIRDVPKSFLYPRLQKDPPDPTDISVEFLLKILGILRGLFCRRGLMLETSLGVHLKSVGKISDRIGGERRSERPLLRLQLEILEQDDQRFLQIVAEDNCGGFNDEILLRTQGVVTFDSWSAYLNETEHPRGMGFLMLARYAAASDGHCRISNISDPEEGARVEILLPLQVQ
ncbi:MAG: hypothetical protein LC778_19675 [Acidobacteria bacterium]|nr:hypothetical protein [Acidobacteriota bacterium]